MTANFEFGAYIPRSFLDEMNHAEAYISARILFWLSKKEEVYKTDEQLAYECNVSIRSLQGWKKKVKETHPLGLDFYVQDKPYKRTFYTRKNCGMVTQILHEDTAKSAPAYIEHKIQHKPPISPKGTLSEFSFSEDYFLSLLRHLFPSWTSDLRIELCHESKLVSVITKGNFTRQRLDNLMMSDERFCSLKRQHGFEAEVLTINK